MNEIHVNSIDDIISYDFKHANTDFDYENALFNIYKERQLKDITTDTFIQDMFSDNRPTNEDYDNVKRSNNRFNFLAYVYTYLNLKLKLELPQVLSENNVIMKSGEDVFLLFKGGNMMYYKYEELKTQVKPVLQEQFFKIFDNNFKISDFDFTCYIVVKDRERFYKVKKTVNQILWKETTKIRNFFETYMNAALEKNVNPELTTLQPQQHNQTFYAFDNLDMNNIDTNKEVRIQNIKDILFQGVECLTPQDKIEIVLNKAMQITEQITDDTKIDFQQIQSTLFHLRKYLYRKLIYHKTPNKLSQSFDVKYKQDNETLRTIIVLMWKKLTNYMSNLPIYDGNEFINVIKKNHIPTLLLIHEILTYVKKYKNIIFDNQDNVNDLVINQQLNNIHRFLQKFVEEFALIFENKIVESDLYNIFTLSKLLKNIKQNIDYKKNPLWIFFV